MKEQTSRPRVEEALEEALRNQRMGVQNNLWSYLRTTLSYSSLWGLFRRALEWLRRFRLVTQLVRILTLVWSVLQTGATVILFTLLFLIALPLLVALMLGILLTALLETRRSNRLLLTKTEGRQVYVLFLPRAQGSFCAANAYDLSTRQGCTVIAVSPYWISSKGLGEEHFYCTVRREASSLYLIRPFYLFPLKRHVLSKRQTAYLY